ncbi:hypothetical protein Mal15_21840 [Stieleria maiorica]|uniref:Uncharacterized protein n=1 Tax=Stieleria maiorica TaxID=2795974 RepID=A0A5B9MD18_9BACT|nr:hypothetical protein [Stieleria maiorica]QEF98136.1 hypothetical protein Mal15_21840 [Stieleria maiorica]
MPGKILVNRLRELLTQQAAIQKQELDLRVEIQIVERQLQLLSLGGGTSVVPVDENQQFIEKYRDQLEPEDIEFLSKKYRSTKEVVEYTGFPRTSLRRDALERGTIEYRKDENGNIRYKTISVMRKLLNVKAEEKR